MTRFAERMAKYRPDMLNKPEAVTRIKAIERQAMPATPRQPKNASCSTPVMITAIAAAAFAAGALLSRVRGKS